MDIVEIQIRDASFACRHPWELARVELISGIVDSLLQVSGSKEFHVLDLGCGDGYMTVQLATRFRHSRFYGVDIGFDDTLLQRLQASTTLPNVTFAPRMNDLALKKREIDCVLLLDVIEHIENDQQFLSELSKNDLLGVDCFIVVIAPSFQTLYSAHDKRLRHIRRYNLSTLQDVINNANFHIKRKSYMFFLLFLFRVFEVAVERLGMNAPTEEIGVAQWKFGSVLTNMIKNILLIDIKICFFLSKFKIYIRGLSCFMICQKRRL